MRPLRRRRIVRDAAAGTVSAGRSRGQRKPPDGDAAPPARTARAPDDVLAVAQAVTEQTRRLREQTASLTRVHEAIREANQRFTDLYDFVPVPYLIVSNLGIIQHINDAALRLLGGEREFVVGRPLIGYVDPPEMRKVLDGVLGSSLAFTRSIEVRIRAKGAVHTVQMMARRRVYGNVAPTYHIAFLDLTEVRRLEQERRQAEADREASREAERVARATSAAKDEFLAMLSHELRTPLTPILAAADALVAHEELSPSLLAKMEIIRRNVKAEARLIDDLLDVARINRKKLDVHRAPADVHRVLGEVLDGWLGPLAQRHITADVRLDAAGHWVHADGGRLAQVFRNIIGNAAKFTETGDTVTVRTEAAGDRLLVTIADTGAGMTAAQIDGLFKPFVQSKEPSPRRGLGLGLVISRAIVEAHDATLEVSSRGPGAGTTVRVELPTIPAPALQDAPATVHGEPRRTAKVLLVEDDRDTAEMLAMLLSLEGFEVQVAASLQAARALAGGCEVVVSDIALPDGNGLELMRHLRERHPMRGIALSGYGSSRDVQRSLDAGFEEHLTKPVDLERLVAAVRRLTETKG